MPAARPASQPAPGPLDRYWSKRNFKETPEPRGVRGKASKALRFVVQKHDATRLHCDFRLELGGVLLSWAVPKGPSFDPATKRMAVRTEDHPMTYADFEGTIPPKHYGAGTVIVWDRGTWEPLGNPEEGLQAGKLAFVLHGDKLAGAWELIRLKKPGERQEVWLLFKKRDEHARSHAEFDVVSALPDSVLSGTGPSRVAKASSKAARAKTSTEHAAPSDKAPAAIVKLKSKGSSRPAKTALPETISPQLATLATAVPATGEWIYEVKFDGYRVMTRIARGAPTLITRGGHDWTAKMPSLAKALKALDLRSAWLDGEIVVFNEHGLPDFNALQNAFDRSRTASIVYFVFDLLFLDGHDLREQPLQARRALLKQLLADVKDEPVRFSADFEADAASVLQSACQLNLEGVIAKRADAPYESRRSTSWLKLKCQQRQEFVIGGYTVRSDDPGRVGSLLLGVHDRQARLVSVGSVGTGWSTSAAAALLQALKKLDTAKSPFAADGQPAAGRWTRGAPRETHWVRPTQVAEVSFGEWTPDGHIRHAVYVALRTDKPARAITREETLSVARGTPKPTAPPSSSAAAPRKAPSRTAAPALSHPERVIDPSTGLTKLDLARYYERVADWILPHLVGRPCSLVRGPSGVEGTLFFQKHVEKLQIPGVTQLDPALWPAHDALLAVESLQALQAAAQMNVIEFHTWNATVSHIDKPDRMVFDLDPGEGTPWEHVQEAATLTRALLVELGLTSWLETSGGKGLHVVVPLAPRYDWDTVKGFSHAIVQHLADVIPSRFVAKSGPSNRVGKIFADYLRNGHGATTAAAFSARARPGMGVSMPVSWDELSSLQSGAHWNVATARDHLSFQKQDPWADYASTRQPLARAMKALGYKPPATAARSKKKP
ncbi:MAG: ATP-dependent ligase [Pseudomonadota bacterium]|jgi:bifunctional non-homologous end joining protein LigD